MNSHQDPIGFREEGRTQKPAYGLGYFGHLDPEPPLVLVYLTVLSILVGVGVVFWLGWSWLTLILTVSVAVSVLAIAYLLKRNRHQDRSSIPEWR